jgi:hypothetical protein
MAAPFWRNAEEPSDFRVSCSAVIEGVGFLDPKAILNPGTAPAADSQLQHLSEAAAQQIPILSPEVYSHKTSGHASLTQAPRQSS